MAEKTALVILAHGAEEMEAVITIDVLRRAKINVIVAGLDSETIECSRGVNIKADTKLSRVDSLLYDVVVLPGGAEGAGNLARSDDVKKILTRHYKTGNLIAAICAGPTVLKEHGIGMGKRITSYPLFKTQLEKDYTYSENRVVRDGNIVTSRGPGTAMEFALEIVKVIEGDHMSMKLRDGMLVL